MKTAEFYEELSKINKRYWRCGADGYPIRRNTRSRYYYCPLTAVAHSVTGKRFAVCQWLLAAGAIGLQLHVAYRIKEASDGNVYYPVIRRKLLKAVGL